MVDEEIRKDEARGEVKEIQSVRTCPAVSDFKDGGRGNELRIVGGFWNLRTVLADSQPGSQNLHPADNLNEHGSMFFFSRAS